LIVLVVASLWGITILLPFFYLFTDWLDFVDYRLPDWAGWCGAAIFGVALWLLWRSHADLGRNWSVTAEVREKQNLVTSGVFKYMRHYTTGLPAWPAWPSSFPCTCYAFRVRKR